MGQKSRVFALHCFVSRSMIMECMAGAEKGDSSDVKSSSGSSSSCSDSKDKVNSASTSEEITEDISEGACADGACAEGACGGELEKSEASPQSPKPSCTSQEQDMVDFKVIFNKVKHDIKFPLDNTVLQLKDHLNTITGVPQSMQKIMIKGLAKDDQTLREAGVVPGAKVLLVGSKLDDVMSVAAPQKVEVEEKVTISKEPLCRQKIHRDILDKGIPDDVMPGILNSKEALPPFPLSGMLNRWGGKVRLTFKLEQDEVWIGTKEKTQKLSMNSIRNVVSEPIEGYEQYHILAMQLGPSESSRYWVYWVPVQYIDAIKETIMGSWVL